MNGYTEADMKFDSDPLMQEEDYVEGVSTLRRLMDNAEELNKILPGHHYIHVPWGGEPYIRWTMPIQPDSVHARESVLEPPEIPPLEMTQYCFQLYTDLHSALHCWYTAMSLTWPLVDMVEVATRLPYGRGDE